MATLLTISRMFRSAAAHDRLTGALMVSAMDITNEADDPQDPDTSAKRKRLAAQVTAAPAHWTDVFRPAVSQNATLQEESALLDSESLPSGQETQIDSDLKFVVASVWNQFIGMV